uniref:Uncharacterized protein n=1 Tax=Magallana gigas TaxID=29159 RepID=K1PVJ5_MAGGI
MFGRLQSFRTMAKLEMKVMYKPPATAAPASGAMGATGASPTEETQEDEVQSCSRRKVLISGVEDFHSVSNLEDMPNVSEAPSVILW